MIFKWKLEKSSQPYPFGLSAERLSALKTLKDLPAFAIFISLLKDVAEWNGNVLLTSSDYGLMRERLGYIKALRQAIDLLDQILGESQRIDDDRARRSADSNGNEPSSYFGGPWFDALRARLSGD